MDTNEYELLKKEILKYTGVDLNFYKRPQMERRLNTYLMRSSHTTWPTYFHDLSRNLEEQQKLKNYLTINVSSFFRDQDKYETVKSRIVPSLLQMRKTQAKNGHVRFSEGRSLRVWSAGCSRGQEPYSLAMLLAELTGSYTKHYILATDLDKGALAYAQAGGPYTVDDVSNVPTEWLGRYFRQEDGKFFVEPSLQKKITFRQHNMLADPFEDDFDLIVCRNVVIYFTAEVKDTLYRQFVNALRPGGILFVGGTEIISKATDMGLRVTDISFYRREEGAGSLKGRQL